MYLNSALTLIVVGFTLMGCTPSVPVPPPIFNPQNLSDLRARTVVVNADHEHKTLRVAAVIQNNCEVDIKGPFKVEISTTVVGPDGNLISSQEIFEIPMRVTIPSKGGEYITEQSVEGPLFYVDEVGVLPLPDRLKAYRFDVLVDLEHIVNEVDESNNYLKAIWVTSRP